MAPSALTNWPIQQIAETVKPDQAQQSALNDLQDATAKSVNVMQSLAQTSTVLASVPESFDPMERAFIDLGRGTADAEQPFARATPAAR